MQTLTARQQQVLDFINETLSQTGVIPTSREIQMHFGFSSQTAAMNHLKALEKRGAIKRQAGKARAVSILANLPRIPVVNIPIFGSIVAGMAETVEQESVGTLAMDAGTLGGAGGQNTFALRVRGDSMIDAQIADGDLAILERRPPRAGEIVAALIDGETTLKRYVVEQGKPYLKAENANYPNLIPVSELLSQGVLVALVRKYRG